MNIPVRRYFALLFRYLRPQWFKTLMMIICLLAGIASQLVYPQLVGYFINTITTHGPITALVGVSVIYMVAALLNQGVAIASSYFSQYVAWTATNQLRSDLLAHCLALDMGFHKMHTSGEMIERIDGDIDALSNFFSDFAVNLMSNLLLLIVILILFFAVNWLVGVVMIGYVLLALFLLSFLRRRATPRWKEQRRMSAVYYGFLSERLDGLEDIRANGAAGSVMRGLSQQLQTWLPINNRAMIVGAQAGILMGLLFSGGTVLALSLGLFLWNLKLVSLGVVYIIFSYTNTLTQPLDAIQNEMQDLQQAEACIQRVENLLNLPSALADTGVATLPAGPLSVELDAVEFGYEPNEPVLRGMSFRIEPGKALGLLGRTGSGKTTLARLLFRLYDPQLGEVRVQGIPLRAIGLHELRRHIGMVTQDVQIFHASVRDNLTFFERGISDKRIIAILEELGLGVWYRSLPDGLDTLLGSAEGERGLSAGESQLLACARVFLVDPGILILDEASSRLDPASEALLERAIGRLLKGRTVLIIAHRLSTLQRVDDLLLIEKGLIVEYGPRAELESDPTSHFARLLQSEIKEVLT